MSRRPLRMLALACAVFVGAVSEAQAQRAAEISDAVPTLTMPAVEFAVAPTAISQAVRTMIAESAQLPPLRRPAAGPRIGRGTLALGTLYASTAMMQALDVHSTLQGISRGATEVNPLMKGLVKNRPAFIAAKAAVAGTMILGAREVAKKNRVAAVLTLVAVNAVYGAVVHHNYRVARHLR